MCFEPDIAKVTSGDGLELAKVCLLTAVFWLLFDLCDAMLGTGYGSVPVRLS